MSCRTLIPVNRPSTYLCENCSGLIPSPSSTRCAFCTNPTIGGATCRWCSTSHALDILLVAADYGQNLTVRLVKGLKYRFVRDIANDMAAHMTTHLKNRSKRLQLSSQTTLITPIPLHKHRLKWRGFNQADLLASHIANKLSLPYQADVLTRLKSTKAQADIEDRESRIKNMQGMFAVTRPESIKNKTVVLIDDVSTTGSTLDNASRVLKDNGAQRVIGFVFARG